MVGYDNGGVGIVPTIPLGGYNNNGWGFGDNGGIWAIVLLAALFGFGGFGWGGFGGGFGGGWGNGFGGFNASDALTRADIQDSFNYANLENTVRSTLDNLQQDTCNLNTTILNGIAGLTGSLTNGFNNVNNNLTENRFAQQQCCCDTNRNIDAMRAEAAANTCSIIQASHDDTDRILGYLTNQKIENLQNELQSARIIAQNNRQTQELIEALKPTPMPAYLTLSPYQSIPYGFTGYGASVFNNGLGFGGFSGI